MHFRPLCKMKEKSLKIISQRNWQIIKYLSAINTVTVPFHSRPMSTLLVKLLSPTINQCNGIKPQKDTLSHVPSCPIMGIVECNKQNQDVHGFPHLKPEHKPCTQHATTLNLLIFMDFTSLTHYLLLIWVVAPAC